MGLKMTEIKRTVVYHLELTQEEIDKLYRIALNAYSNNMNSSQEDNEARWLKDLIYPNASSMID